MGSQADGGSGTAPARRPIEGGYVAAAAGGLVGVLVGGGLAWLFLATVTIEGSAGGMAGAFVGLLIVAVVTFGGGIGGLAIGVALGLRVAGHRGALATGAVAVVVAVAPVVLLFVLPFFAWPVAALALLGAPPFARWAVVALMDSRAGTVVGR